MDVEVVDMVVAVATIFCFFLTVVVCFPLPPFSLPFPWESSVVVLVLVELVVGVDGTVAEPWVVLDRLLPAFPVLDSLLAFSFFIGEPPLLSPLVCVDVPTLIRVAEGEIFAV